MRVAIKLATIELVKIPPITIKDTLVGTCIHFTNNIFVPTNIKTKAKPNFNKWKRFVISANKKYKARKPIIAKIFEVNTMNGSVVTAKIAGIESTANTTSEISIKINTSSKRIITAKNSALFKMASVFSHHYC